MHPHVFSRVILRIEGEHTRWPDHDVVNVGFLRTDRYRVDDMPIGSELSQPSPNFFFPIGTYAKVAFGTVSAKNTSQDRLNRCLLA
jgi:hypothetical protein